MIRISPKLQLIASGFLVQGLRVATTLAMARLLSPKDYGAYLLVIALPGLVGAMGDFGIPTTLVQLREASEEAIIHTATVLGIALYIVYGLITVGGGMFLAFTEHDGRLLGVAAVVALTNLLTEIYNIQLAVLNRRLDFRAEAQQNVIASLSTGAAGVAFAAGGFGIYALALQGLVGQLVANLSVLRASPLGWPKQFSMPLAKQYFRLGGKVSLALYVNNVQVNITNLLVKHLGDTPMLGAWNRAVTVVQMCGQNLLASFERVIYPLLCKSAGDPEYRRALFVRSTFLLMLPSAFATSWLIAGRAAVVRLVLGPQWGDVPSLLLVAALAVPAGVFYTMGYRTVYALGRTGLMLRSGIIDLISFVPMIAALWHFGIIGVAAAWVISRYVSAGLLLGGIWRDIRPPTATLVRRIGLMLGAATVSGLVLTSLDRWLAAHGAGGPLLIRFALSSCVALAVYVVIVRLTMPDLIHTVLLLSRGTDADRDTRGFDVVMPAGTDVTNGRATAAVVHEPGPGAGASEDHLMTGDPETLVAPEQRT